MFLPRHHPHRRRSSGPSEFMSPVHIVCANTQGAVLSSFCFDKTCNFYHFNRINTSCVHRKAIVKFTKNKSKNIQNKLNIIISICEQSYQQKLNATHFLRR